MKRTTREITEIAVFTALLSVTAWISFPIGGVPITLQTLIVMLIGLFLRPKNSALSVIAYLIIGSIGLPVFAQGKGGIGVLLGPTGGFLLSFILMVIFISIMKNVKIIKKKALSIFVILLLANILIYMIGWTYYGIYTNTSIALVIGILWPFALADFVKIVIATYVYLNMHSYVTYERS
jgi:biotin transport system substrate-specific component